MLGATDNIFDLSTNPPWEYYLLVRFGTTGVSALLPAGHFFESGARAELQMRPSMRVSPLEEQRTNLTLVFSPLRSRVRQN
jgi:hypothetical protein